MNSLNKVQLIGNLTRDPEIKIIPGENETRVATIDLATNRPIKNKEGEWDSVPDYHRVIAWKKLAEISGKYLRKGSKVYIEGRLQTKTWENEEGKKQYRLEVVATNIIFLEKKKEGEIQTEEEPTGPSVDEIAKEMNTPPEKTEDATLDDFPF